MKRDLKQVAGVIIGLIVVTGLGFGPKVVLADDCLQDADGNYIDDGSCTIPCEAPEDTSCDADYTYDSETCTCILIDEAVSDGSVDAATDTSTVVSTSSTTTSTSTVHTLSNPLGSTDFRKVIGYVIKALLGLSGAVALFVFVWSGIMMMLAAGDAKKITTAKNSLTWATIGLVVIFTAYTLVYTLITALSTAT